MDHTYNRRWVAPSEAVAVERYGAELPASSADPERLLRSLASVDLSDVDNCC